MKIAIFHNFMDNIGGAELVDLILAKELKADIYTTNINETKIRKMGFTTSRIFSIGSIPISAPWRQEAAYWRFRFLNLGNKYDYYIIGGDWAVGGAILNRPNLWYVYSPIREIWDLSQITRNQLVPWYGRWLFDVWVNYHRFLNKNDIKRVGKIIATSKNVQGRIKRYFNREVEIVYPPVETKKFYYNRNGNFWLSVNRLINHKRVEMQLKAFAKMPTEKLIIVGSYEKSFHFKKYAATIKKNKPKNVEIVSWLDQNDLLDLYANCRGLVTTAFNEDFGLAAVEALASGKPVIAPNEGGYRETVIDRVTGRLINDIDEEKIITAVKEVGLNPLKYKEACLRQAQKFDTKIFIEKIKKFLTTPVE